MGRRKLGFMQISKAVRKHASPARRREVLENYRQTHLNQRDFAAQAGISVSTLHKWLQTSPVVAASDLPQFVALPNVVPRPTPGPDYRLVLPSGIALEVRTGFTARELATWLELLPLP